MKPSFSSSGIKLGEVIWVLDYIIPTLDHRNQLCPFFQGDVRKTGIFLAACIFHLFADT